MFQKNVLVYLIVFVFLFVAILTGWTYLKRSSNEKYNVIIIDIDHVRADALPCYGYERNTTPNICSLAESGVLFKNNYSESYWTLPSIATILTSLYPSAHKVSTAYRDAISDQMTTLSEVYHNNGYKTAFIGPKEGDVSYLPAGFKRGIDLRVGVGIEGWKEAIGNLTGGGQPFFAYFFAGELHIPYVLAEGNKPIFNVENLDNFPDTQRKVDEITNAYLLENYRDVFTEGAIEAKPDIFKDIKVSGKQQVLDYYNSFGHPSDMVKAPWDVEYAAFMEYLDKNVKGNPLYRDYMKNLYDTKLNVIDNDVGILINDLRSKGLWKNTVIVVISNHGEEFEEHGGFAHYKSLYNEVLHTPLIIYKPGYKPTVVENISENVDLYPTLLSLTNIHYTNKIQGKDLSPLMLGKKVDKKYAIGEMDNKSVSIQDNEWKLIIRDYRSENPELELFNKEGDYKEQHNLSDKYEDIVSDLSAKLRTILTESEKLYNVTPSDFPGWMDESTRKRLIERGYF